MSLEVDYIHTKGACEKDTIDNVNLVYDAATGANIPFTNANRARLPWPDMGVVSMIPHDATSELRSLQTAFTKRMSQPVAGIGDLHAVVVLQLAATSRSQGCSMVPFEVQPDLGNEWGLSADDQRHRAVFNGIWQVGRGFQLSGLHFFAAGMRSGANYGGDLRAARRAAARRGCVRTAPSSRATTFMQPAQNKTDIRVQQRIPLGGRVALDGDRGSVQRVQPPELGRSRTQESSANYNVRTTAQFRSAQVGFRLTF